MLNNKRYSISKIIIFLLLIILIIVVFRNWFTSSILSSGDWMYFFKQSVEEGGIFSPWDSRFNGMGISQIPTLWINSYFTLTLKTVSFIPWQLYERLFWFFPFLIFSFLSSIYLSGRISALRDFTFATPLIFLFNTYSLLVIGGGQLGVALAYSLAPLVMGIVLRNFELLNENIRIRLKYSLITALCFSLQILFDPRIFYITFSAIFLFFIFNIFIGKLKINISNLFFLFLVPFGVTILLHLFWVIPLLVARENPFDELGNAYSSIGMVKFLSFARLESAMSVLHPNWPENIFGKVYFQRPEFLIFPLLAFSSLLFIKKSEKLILFFVLLSLIGIFLAKGANEPFGNIYLFLFDNFPGFRLFRDPIKWYILIVISYSILIPYSVSKIYEYLKNKDSLIIKKYLGVLFLILISIGFIVSIFPIINSDRGTYRQRDLPVEYVNLASKLSNDNDFYRIIWIPSRHKFAYSSEIHPAVSAESFFNTGDRKKLLNTIIKSSSQKKMLESSIKYIAVPFDTDGEFFLDDRKYSEKEYLRTISEIEKIPWIVSKESIGKIVLFKIGDPKGIIWCNCNAKIGVKKESNVRYLVNVKNANKDDRLVFSQKYSKNWEAVLGEERRGSVLYSEMNSFYLAEGDSEFEIYYRPNDSVRMFSLVSIGGLIFIIVLITYIQFIFIGKNDDLKHE